VLQRAQAEALWCVCWNAVSATGKTERVCERKHSPWCWSGGPPRGRACPLARAGAWRARWPAP
jgi:hypothetical protein